MRDTNNGVSAVPQTLNQYVYSNNNPVLLADPNGNLFGLDDLIAVGGGALLGAGVSIVSQAIAGDGINWEKVGSDAVFGAITVETGDDPLVGLGLNIVHSAINNCIDSCGKPDFNIGNYLINSAADGIFDTGVGLIAKPVIDNLNLGSKIAQGTGDELSNLASNLEDGEAQSFLYRLSAYVTGGDVPSWFSGSTDAWNEAIASHINDIIEQFSEGVIDGFKDRFKVDDAIDEYLKQIIEGGANK